MKSYELGKDYTRIIAENANKALKVNDLLFRDITLIGVDLDISAIEEVDLVKEK